MRLLALLAATLTILVLAGPADSGQIADRGTLSVRNSAYGRILFDGRRQVAYAGRLLYYYVKDRRPGQILCQNVFEFGGNWLVVRPSGSFVE
jgi:hypothetical protein